jgi:hypothetical protein
MRLRCRLEFGHFSSSRNALAKCIGLTISAHSNDPTAEKWSVCHFMSGCGFFIELVKSAFEI